MADIEIAKKEDLDRKADIDHNHDGVYQPVGDYAISSHDHDYSEINNTPNIPTSTSELANDSGYITGEYDNSASGLSATDIQSAIDELKSLIDGLSGD